MNVSGPVEKKQPNPGQSEHGRDGTIAQRGLLERWLGKSRSEAWDSLQLGTQLRLVAAVSVLCSLSLAAVTIGLWEIHLARQLMVERGDDLAATIAHEIDDNGLARTLLGDLVRDRAVQSARLLTADGTEISAYAAPAWKDDAAAARLAQDSNGWMRALQRKLRSVAEALWLAPVHVSRPIQLPQGGAGTLAMVVDAGALWSIVTRHLTAIPFVLLIGCVLALVTARMFQRSVTDPLARLAVATRGGQWTSNDMQAGASAPVNAVSEIIDNFEAMRERLAQNERDVLRVKRKAEEEVTSRTSQLEQRLDVAERSARAQSDFLASMSHEIRTPMNGVVGMAELLSRTRLDERQQRFLRSMRAASDAMVRIINDILDVTKIDSGNMEFVPEPCVLRDLVEDVGQLYAARAQTKGIELICRIEPSVPGIVSADVLRLRQVLGNLVSNAVKYTERGEIELRVSSNEVREGQRRVFFEVADTGPGIPEAQHALIFEPYKQLGNASPQGGTGLGLPIAVRLVKLMGGSSIDLHSSPGHGSRFAFSLPMEVLEVAPRTRPPARVKGMRVLVVDDNPRSYLFLEDMIASWGADVTVLPHGKLLRDRLRTAAQERSRFEVVVLDHSVPDATLADMLRTIRVDPDFARTHVVLMSALDFVPLHDRGVALEPDICISKPVRQQQLADALELARGPLERRTPGESTAGAAADAGAHGNGGIAGLKVLVVDDNAINREVAVAMLEERGCVVALAQDGSEAVVSANSEHFDLILMDCQMPVLDGYAATENIRREERADGKHPASIVALTANVMPRDRERCVECGMNDVLIKPFSGAELDRVLLSAAENAVPALPERGAPAHAPVEGPSLDDTVPQLQALAPDFNLFEEQGAPDDDASGEPVLDPEQITAIRGLNKPQLLEQLYGMLHERAPSALESIENALAAGDLDAVRVAAHGFRSPVGTLGGRRLAAQLGRCEHAADAGDLEAAQIHGAGLREAYARLDLALKAELADSVSTRTGT
jgi:signal transduction histidine kinase/DNA-binding response OmpR family regulator/HPt (histidine-containing phosphotransfer) domain-containing protein